MSDFNKLIDRLEKDKILSKEEYLTLLSHREECRNYLAERASIVRKQYYGDAVYIRGLIEFTNICKNNCLYCGIRRDNNQVSRYRLTAEDILNCCDEGYQLGFRTFVLQGGEDGYFSDDVLVPLVAQIKQNHPDCAITLSVGERSYESYRALRLAGADRYLLRHETATKSHYEQLHPQEMSFENRIRCLKNLKELGYQVGAGFMVGSPGQTMEHLVNDLLFLKELRPQMVGIGPFISQHDTPFASQESGSVELTLFLLSLLRLTLPNILLPATTALGTLDAKGREKGILAGANVLMPNLSPVSVRKKYALYDNKICTGEEAAQCINCLKSRIESVGCHIVIDRGDCKMQ